MNKIFYFLLFCSISGAGVLWWLMASIKEEQVQESAQKSQGLVIEDTTVDALSEMGVDLSPEETESSPSQEGIALDESAMLGQMEGEADEDAILDEDVDKEGSLFEDTSVISKPTTLSITSVPTGVNVYLNGDLVGQTPVERILTDKVQKFRFEKEGYVPVEREAPAEEKPEGAFMSWRISMVEQQLPPAEKSRIQDMDTYFVEGVLGPAFVQVRSLQGDVFSKQDIIEVLRTMRKQLMDEKVVACAVDLASRGKWYRVLVGPFASQDEAKASVDFVSKSLNISDVFVTGAQTCL